LEFEPGHTSSQVRDPPWLSLTGFLGRRGRLERAAWTPPRARQASPPLASPAADMRSAFSAEVWGSLGFASRATSLSTRVNSCRLCQCIYARPFLFSLLPKIRLE